MPILPANQRHHFAVPRGHGIGQIADIDRQQIHGMRARVSWGVSVNSRRKWSLICARRRPQTSGQTRTVRPASALPGFSALLDRLESNGVRTVAVEDASRFARDLVAQDCTAHRSHSPAKLPPIAGSIQHSERHPEVTRCGDELVVLI